MSEENLGSISRTNWAALETADDESIDYFD